MASCMTVSTPQGASAIVCTTNDLERWRWETWLTKEPETIAWIDSWCPPVTFIDVGANVGVFSVYCALHHGWKVPIVAIEPLGDNLRSLRENLDHMIVHGSCVVVDKCVGTGGMRTLRYRRGAGCSEPHGPVYERFRCCLGGPMSQALCLTPLHYILGAVHTLTDFPQRLALKVDVTGDQEQDVLDSLGYYWTKLDYLLVETRRAYKMAVIEQVIRWGGRRLGLDEELMALPDHSNKRREQEPGNDTMNLIFKRKGA